MSADLDQMWKELDRELFRDEQEDDEFTKEEFCVRYKLTLRMANRRLKKLLDKGVISKRLMTKNGKQMNAYRVITKGT